MGINITTLGDNTHKRWCSSVRYDIKNYFKTIPITLICILGVSLAMIGMYPMIHKAADRYTDRYLTSGDLNSVLIQSNYALYSEMQGKELIAEYVEDGVQKQERVSIDWLNNLRMDYISLEYAAIDNITQGITSNISRVQDKIQKEALVERQLEEEYDFYVVMEYDTEGNIRILSDSMNGDTIFTSNTLSAEQSIKQILSKEGISEIKEMTYFYGIAKGKHYNDELTWGIETSLDMGYRESTVKVMCMATLIVIMGAALVPYSIVKRNRWGIILTKIPLEIYLVGMALVLFVQFNEAGKMIYNYKNGQIASWIEIYMGEITLPLYVIKIFNVITWIIFFSVVVIGVWTLKRMYHKGGAGYLKQCTLIGMGYSYTKGKLIRKADILSRTHFEELEPKKLKKFMIINGLLLSGLCCIWFLGIIGVVIYMISIYGLVNHIVNQVKDYYGKLLDTTEDLARGVLDTQISSEDIGAFEPLKLHIAKIQYAFKASVEEELRSQKIKTDLITNVSHDLRTPLTSIISYIDLLKQENLSDQIREEYIDILDRKSIRLQTLIEDLFEISKASSGNIQFNIEQVDVVALIKQTLFESEDRLQASTISFRTKFPSNKVYLMLDGLRSFRIFDNLINNIIKYGMPYSRAYIELEERPNEVVIVFKNTAREELDFDAEQITERFVRGDQSRKTEGSGLGLAIAKSFVELQQGQFQVDIDGDLFKVIIRFKKLN